MALMLSYDLTLYDAALTLKIAQIPQEQPPLTTESYARRLLDVMLTDITRQYNVVSEAELEAAVLEASPAVQADIEAYTRAKLGI